ncbi:MAG: hypothetical protein ACFFDT_22435 [Candidatus Hodarchaeota archaeon]
MPSLTRLEQEIRKKTSKWGADLIGFAPTERFSKFSLKNQPQIALEEAKTVIVIGIHMVDPILDLWLHADEWKQQGKPSRAFEDEILRGVAYRLVLYLERAGYRSEVLPYEPSLYLKEAGYYAGLGVFGKNNLLINPIYGPNIRLRALTTVASLTPSPLINKDYCGSCNHCIKACPPNALEGGYNKERCLSYATNQVEFLSSKAVLWCVKCITSCPYTKKANND